MGNDEIVLKLAVKLASKNQCMTAFLSSNSIFIDIELLYNGKTSSHIVTVCGSDIIIVDPVNLTDRLFSIR